MGRWNPHDPQVIGPEFFGTLRRFRYPTRTAHLVQRFHASSSETIANVRAVVNRSIDGPRPYLLEIVPAAGGLTWDTAADAVDQSRYNPNAVANLSGTIRNELGFLPGNAASIDDGDTPNFDDWIGIGTDGRIDLEFASAAYPAGGSGANRRIAAVAFLISTPWGTNGTNPGSDAARRAVCSIVSGGTTYGTITHVIPPNNGFEVAGRQWWTWGEMNPVTGLPWTAAQVASFDAGTYRLRIARRDADDGQLRISHVQMVVVYETDDRIVAHGVYNYTQGKHVGATFGQWIQDVPLTQPDGTANWSKVSGTNYRLVIREADQGDLSPVSPPNAAGFATLEAVPPFDPPADYLADDTLTVQSSNEAAALQWAPPLPIYVPTASKRLLVAQAVTTFALRTTGPATSADSQPYYDVTAIEVHATSGSTQGELRTSVSDDYRAVRVVAGHAGTPPTAELTIGVRRRSDNALIGTCRVPASDAVLWTLATGQLATPAAVVEADADAAIPLVSGTQYALDFSSNTDETAPWLIALLVTDNNYEIAGYGGQTDTADPVNGASGSNSDFAAVMDRAIDAPNGFAVSVGAYSLPDVQPDGVALTGVPYALVEWNATSLAANFLRYEIQRLGADGATWQTIAEITDESVESFYDSEGRLGVEESYRMRVVRADENASFWTDTETGTAPAAGCGYTFSTNEQPELAVAYPDVYGTGSSERKYDYPDAGEVQFRAMHGRDYQVAFRPLAQRGVTFERRLLVAGLEATSGTVGPPAAEALRAIANATLSYVCVRDQDGNRFFAAVQVKDLTALGLDDGDSALHSVNVTVTEVTDIPVPADAVA